ncbi:MAG: GH32 C-terminal domain-containing protein, partial [Bacteroidota bacterium]
MSLRPQPGFSSVGVWSGTTFFKDNGEPVIAYTGVNGAIAGIGIAEAQDEDLIAWQPLSDNPVIDRAPTSIPNQDFRDPYVWREGDTYYMVVGSGRANNGGGILMSYTSTDYQNWTLIPPIFEAPSLAIGGRFWEMPYFNRINETDYIFVVTPQFVGSPARTIYWVGSFDGAQFEPYHEMPKDFELIRRNLLSPAIGNDEEDRLAYIGIIPEDRNVEDQIAAGWRQTFSIPRVLRLLEDGETLGHYPHPNLCRARRNEVIISERMIDNGTSENISEYQGTQSELYFKLHTGNTAQFDLQFYKNAAGTEWSSLTVDKQNGRIGINRVFSSPYNTAEIVQYGDYDFRPDDTLSVRIFLDHSICEVFIDNLVVLSARVYPSFGSDRVDVVLEEGTLDIVEFKAWDIGDKSESFPPQICIPDDLPAGLFTSVNQPTILDIPVRVFPNPTRGICQITLPDDIQDQEFTFSLTTVEGKVIYEKRVTSIAHSIHTIVPSQLPGGVYWAQLLTAQNQRIVFKILHQP